LSTAFEKNKGRLPWPVEGAIVKEFGKIVHPVYKTVTMSIGVDIGTGRGERVECVASGKVEYVGWMRGYGQFVIVNHPGGYLTIYAHLDSIMVAKDKDVATGEALGTVGETGSLDGAKLHFQVRKSSDPLNPREWLEKRDDAK
jgi:septal ring factor EnvC (AmiA/AmiB activator)